MRFGCGGLHVLATEFCVCFTLLPLSSLGWFELIDRSHCVLCFLINMPGDYFFQNTFDLGEILGLQRSCQDRGSLYISSSFS